MQNESTRVQNSKWRQILAIAIPCMIGWGYTYFSIFHFHDYSYSLFIGIPLAMGAVSTFIMGFNNQTRKISYALPFQALLIFCLGLLVFAWEGLVCLVMTFPISALAHFIGYILVNYLIIKRRPGTIPTVALVLILPLLMAFEYRFSDSKPRLRSVVTSIEINASPDEVWKNVISFPELEEPDELIFKSGIAYPTSATINGSGQGAVRHCNFSTGTFVEPVTVWEEARLLRFSVVQQPPTMKEISFYDIHPGHLNGYWVSKEGQFRLIKLANGRTILEGTTWYENRIRPAFYWTLWSDYIVHKIHNRVLTHIRNETEKKGSREKTL